MRRTRRWSVSGVVLAVLLIAVPEVGATEILTNGDFETGDFTGWTANNAMVSGTHAALGFTVDPFGSYMAVLSPTAGETPSPHYLDADLSQLIDLSAYDSATLSFSYNLSYLNTNPSASEDSFQVFLGSVMILEVALADPCNPDRGHCDAGTSSGWLTYSETLPASLLTGPLSFRFALDNFSPGGSPSQDAVAYIDTVSVRGVTNPDPAPIPEPGILLLFGTGLLAATVLRRRRSGL